MQVAGRRGQRAQSNGAAGEVENDGVSEKIA